ncbi:MAG: hemerythrin [Acidimicrobiales bacterium]|jgi:hemerythrin-like domain-containing protein|nr:hemerythrin [Acidimicrobiales bacterium]
MDAITLLKEDHKEVKRLFREFEKLGERAVKAKQEIATHVIEALSVHSAIEEQIFYPSVRKLVPDLNEAVLEALEEHHVAKWLLAELEDMTPEHERFDAKMKVLTESVRHHVEEEEGELFPEVREALGRKALAEIGEQMEQARRVAPTRPHPKAPDEPPGNLVAGPAAAVVDRARELGREVIDRARG